MKMIRHHLIYVQQYMFAYLFTLPSLFIDDLAERIEYHLVVDNLSQDALPVPNTDRYKVTACEAMVISFQPDRSSSLSPLTHGIHCHLKAGQRKLKSKADLGRTSCAVLSCRPYKWWLIVRLVC